MGMGPRLSRSARNRCLEVGVPDIFRGFRKRSRERYAEGQKKVHLRQARPIIQVFSIKVRSSKPIPCSGRVNKRQVRIQDTPPAPSDAVDGIGAGIAEIRIPLFRHEILVPGVPTARINWDHMYSLNVLVIGAKVSGVVDFVFEEDARVLVTDEVGRLVDIAGLEEEVVLESTFLNSEHQIPTSFHGCVANGMAPKLHGVGKQGVFRCGFLVFSVATVKQALSPRVPVIPVETSGHRKIGIVW